MKIRRRLDYLDSLRGSAAFAVYLWHYACAFGGLVLPAWISRSPLNGLWDAWGGVSLFFVLSGFVLARKFFIDDKRFDLAATLSPFYFARLMRIYLPFLVFLVLSLALFQFAPHPATPGTSAWFRAYWNDPPSLDRFLRQAWLFRPTLLDTQRLIPVDWTLTIELNLSFWVPFLIAIAQVSAGALVVFAAVGIFLLGAPIYLLHFALGILMAKHGGALRAWLGSRRVHWFFAMSLAAAFYSYRFVDETLLGWLPHGRTLCWALTAIGAAAILSLALSSRRMQAALELRPWVALGRISYSFYLIHFALLKTVTPQVLQWTARHQFFSPAGAAAAAFAATTLLVVVAASLGYRFIEQPSVRLGQWALRRVRPLPARAAQAA